MLRVPGGAPADGTHLELPLLRCLPPTKEGAVYQSIKRAPLKAQRQPLRRVAPGDGGAVDSTLAALYITHSKGSPQLSPSGGTVARSPLIGVGRASGPRPPVSRQVAKRSNTGDAEQTRRSDFKKVRARSPPPA
ncbi:hypothetical protein SKAU_G00065190 [Synaphobranchus kaupii]|uniref:Uncharacterized protein n=1 Tax=Synaphobranchus kaupii TaxID=118154 RepID=A0A9Q1G6T9_SYNKA|nr:hypothetical protein SKAU_G00065190 [Synaphobranchus kaupii]